MGEKYELEAWSWSKSNAVNLGPILEGGYQWVATYTYGFSDITPSIEINLVPIMQHLCRIFHNTLLTFIISEVISVQL